MLAVPPALLEIVQLEPGSQVGVSVERGRLVIERTKRPHYSLADLLAQCSPKRRRTKAEREWLVSRPAGRELI